MGLQNAVWCDLSDHAPLSADVDVVVADPPWYLDHYAAFIRAAQQLLARGVACS